MISSELIGLLLNKYVLGGVSVLIGLVIAYFKGSKAAKEAAAYALAEAERAQQARLRAAEAKNAFLEKKGEQTNEKINSSDTVDELLGLWNSLQSKQGKDGSSDKKS